MVFTPGYFLLFKNKAHVGHTSVMHVGLAFNVYTVWFVFVQSVKIFGLSFLCWMTSRCFCNYVKIF